MTEQTTRRPRRVIPIVTVVLSVGMTLGTVGMAALTVREYVEMQRIADDVEREAAMLRCEREGPRIVLDERGVTVVPRRCAE